MRHFFLELCTSGKKHKTLPMGVFEYADFKKCGNHNVISMVLTEKCKIQNGRHRPIVK